MPLDESGTDDTLVPLEQDLLPSDFFDHSEAPSGPASSESPLEESATPDETVVIPEFDPRVREDFTGLLYLGALTDEFAWSGHRFKIKTVVTDDLLEVAMLSKEYRDSMGDSRAYVTAFVAASLISVDGQRVASPIGPRESEVSAAFSFIKGAWYPWTIDAVYERCMVLEAKVNDIIEAMGKASPLAA